MGIRNLHGSMLVLLVVPALLLGGAAVIAIASAARENPDAVLAAAGGAPPPHIVGNATAMNTNRRSRETDRKVPYTYNSDGCNHDYGRPGQWFPLHSPPSFAGGTNKDFDCAYLTAAGWFKEPLLIRRDSLNVLPRHRAANKAVRTSSGWTLTACID